MKLFVNDTPVEIKDKKSIGKGTYEHKYNASHHSFSTVKLKDDILFTHATEAYIKGCLDYLNKQKVKKLDSITFLVDNAEATALFIKQQYLVVKAAGGIVRKGDRILLIYRLKKWDLPKGKIEKGETSIEGAQREVEEECQVTTHVLDKVCHTWHTYTRNKKKYLKKTYWYAMECQDDSMMKAQAEEGIEEVKWMREHEAKQALYDSYYSIRYVLRKYFKAYTL